MIKYIIGVFMVISVGANAQNFDKKFLLNELKANSELFKDVLSHPDYHEVQIMYTSIKRDKKNNPIFKTYGFNVDHTRYFYPASTVKLPVVIFALEKLNELGINRLNKETTMLTDSAYTGQSSVSQDPSSPNGLPSIAHYIKKVLLTSDNDGFNRLYEFVGRATINEKLKKYGFNNSRIINRLAIGDSGESSKHGNPIRFVDENNQLIYFQEPSYDPLEYPLVLTREKVGKGYINALDELVMEPFSFVNKNVFSIQDQHLLMQKLMFPNSFKKADRFNLSQDDYAFIYKYMQLLPHESDFPKYDLNTFYPAYAKILYYGRSREATFNPNLKIFNKYGNSYGFILDNAYFKDEVNQVEFIISAVIQSNKNEIYNDNIYEYEEICYPFMKNLGELIYKIELNEKKQPE